MSYFKYLPPERIDVLINSTIRFTQPAALNDLFEFRPTIERITDIPSRKALVLGLIEWLRKYSRKDKTGELQRAEEVTARIIQPDVMRNFREHRLNSDLLEAANRLLSLANDLVGILSLSDDPTDPLMWGHYAASNTGFLIQFYANHPWFKQGPNDDEAQHIRKVKYISMEESSSVDFRPRDFIYTKSNRWEYEREWRMIWPLQEYYRKLPGDIYLFGVPPSCIWKIILGVRSTREFETKLNYIINKIGVRPIPVVRARIDESGSTIKVPGWSNL